MHRAQRHAEMLLVEGDWDVLENALAKFPDFELLDRHAFELGVSL